MYISNSIINNVQQRKKRESRTQNKRIMIRNYM